MYYLEAVITNLDKSKETKLIKLDGIDRNDIVDKLECPPHHKFNLKHYGRAAFKDANGVKHQWVIKKFDDALCKDTK